MTQIQCSNQWNGGIVFHPDPKYSEYKNTTENLSPRFFGINTASLYSKEPYYQYGVLFNSTNAIEAYFEGKFIKLVLLLHDIASVHRALATQKKLA